MRIAIIVVLAAFGLAACGGSEPEKDAGTSTTRMDAVDVPKGTISDEVMPLDARANPEDVKASEMVEAPDRNAERQPAEAKDDTSDSNTESESE